jgi:hypothetical protein
MFSLGLSNGAPRLTVAAPAGRHFRIDYADMPGDGTNWQPMTNFTMMGGISQVSDPVSQSGRTRFYRAVLMP